MTEGSLRRVVGIPGAVFMGLGSIVGTGLFVSLGIAAGVAGDLILLALPAAALLALFNGLSSAQLAAVHPVSGGTYEYGNREIGPATGFTAGWMFLLAKSASAATAALGLGGYLLRLGGWETTPGVVIALGGAGVLALTVLVVGGIGRSNLVNLGIVGVTLVVLALLLALGLGGAADAFRDFQPGAALGQEGAVRDVLFATALLFVAYTGYGRIATLGEEVKDPARTIPMAIWITLGTVALLYMGVAAVALGTIGVEAFARETRETAAPLDAVARAMEVRWLVPALGLAAITAMASVLLNLILGLSRVALAMARRGDLPALLARVHPESGSPRPAVVATGGLILVLVLLGNVETTWTFSAFTVLIYYGITNLSALRLGPDRRLYPAIIPVMGLLGCFFLAFQVPVAVWLTGLGLLGLGHVGRWLLRRSG
ncbi:MAG: amino acid permease [Gemmatimonadales bacterium]|nr:MAG: amino acid permease [Gemmatimonadales bacterium]